MTNKEKFIEVFGEEPQRKYATKSWWEQEYVPHESEVKILDKIRAIVDEWQSDTWTDNLSYECMVKIAELVEPQERNKE